MRVGPVTARSDDGGTTRAAVVTWASGELEVRSRVDASLGDPTDDASAYLCVALPLAMRVGEALRVDGPVSPALLGRVEELSMAYAAWDPALHPIVVDADASARAVEPAGSTRAAFFSRGVDSLFTAAAGRHEGRLDLLVFGDGLEPRHDEAVRLEERRRARLAADAIGLALAEVETDVRTLTDRFGADWEDVLGAGLSFVAHQLAGGCSSVTIPSSDSFGTLEPCGSSPVLDPLHSTERVGIVHDSVARSRLEKLRWLRDRDEALLAHLKVCYAENRPDNCGVCGKCVYTMACLHALDCLPAASQFPAVLDLDRVRSMRLPHLKSRLDWAELARVCEARGDGALLDASLDVLEASALSARWRPGPGDQADRWVVRRWMRDPHLEELLALVLEGRPRLERPPARPATTLLRIDHGEGRFTCTLGELPHPGRVVELGRLVPRPLPGAVPVWVADGQLHLRGLQPPRRAARRAAPTSSPSSPSSTVALDREPDGYLHLWPGADRVPLHLAWHPTKPEQLLTVDPAEADRLGYGPPTLLGHLDTVTRGTTPASAARTRSPRGGGAVRAGPR